MAVKTEELQPLKILMLTEYEARILRGQLEQHGFQTRRRCAHFHTGKAKTASQPLDVSFKRSDEKMFWLQTQSDADKQARPSKLLLSARRHGIFRFHSFSKFLTSKWTNPHYFPLKCNNVKTVFNTFFFFACTTPSAAR